MPWDDLIRAANKAEARAKIQENTHLDQRCPKGKQPLKMSLNTRDDQAKKRKAKALQARTHLPLASQSEASGRTRREKKRMHRGRQGYKEVSPAKSQEDAFKTDASEDNVSQARKAKKKA